VTDKQFEGLCDSDGTSRRLASDPRFTARSTGCSTTTRCLKSSQRFFIGRERRWLYHEGQRRAIPLVPIPSVAEVLEGEQTLARNDFETIDDPVLGKISVPGTAAAADVASRGSVAAAPRLGEHNREIFGGRLGSAIVRSRH